MTICSMTVRNYDGTNRIDFQLGLKVLAIAGPPQLGAQNLGGWQLARPYDWLQHPVLCYSIPDLLCQLPRSKVKGEAGSEGHKLLR